MSEQLTQRTDDGSESPRFNVGNYIDMPVDSSESQTVSFKFVEHVPKTFENNPDAFKLQHLLEMDAENTIVIVGDQLAYFGGQLSADIIPHLEVPVSNYFNPEVKVPGSVKSIMEDGRVIAFATEQEKAIQYISQRQTNLRAAS